MNIWIQAFSYEENSNVEHTMEINDCTPLEEVYEQILKYCVDNNLELEAWG